MQQTSLIFILLSAVAGIAIIAKRLAIPYPIAFVVGGSVLPVRAPSSLSLCVIGLAALIGIRRTLVKDGQCGISGSP